MVACGSFSINVDRGAEAVENEVILLLEVQEISDVILPYNLFICVSYRLCMRLASKICHGTSKPSQ